MCTIAHTQQGFYKRKELSVIMIRQNIPSHVDTESYRMQFVGLWKFFELLLHRILWMCSV